VDFEGETGYIDENGDPFDLWATGENEETTFFEVRSVSADAGK
jgi:hypothetical protein